MQGCGPCDEGLSPSSRTNTYGRLVEWHIRQSAKLETRVRFSHLPPRRKLVNRLRCIQIKQGSWLQTRKPTLHMPGQLICGQSAGLKNQRFARSIRAPRHHMLQYPNGRGRRLKSVTVLVRIQCVAPYASLAQWNQSNGFLPRVSGVRVSQGVPKRKERSMFSFGLCDSTRIRGKPNTYTPLAQRNRALGYEPRCRGFESLKACHISRKLEPGIPIKN